MYNRIKHYLKASKNKWNAKKYIESVGHFLVKSLRSTLGSIAVLLFTFFLVNWGYGLINKYSFKRFSEDQIKSIIEASVNSADFEYVYANFNANKTKELAVLVNSDFSFDYDTFDSTYSTPARLAIFEKVSKNPLEKILFEDEIFSLKKEYPLIPEIFEDDYRLLTTELRTIDIGNDNEDEIFICLIYANLGSGTNYVCSIFDGKVFYTPFPYELSKELILNADTDQNSEINQKSRHDELSVFANYDTAAFSDKPIYSSIHSDDRFFIDDESDELTFIEMIWREDDECHFCPHYYNIYQYKYILPNLFNDQIKSIVFDGGFVKITNKKEEWADKVLIDFLFR